MDFRGVDIGTLSITATSSIMKTWHDGDCPGEPETGEPPRQIRPLGGALQIAALDGVLKPQSWISCAYFIRVN